MAWSSWIVLLSALGLARSITISVSSSGGNKSSPYQYGLMFEDINHSGDGGVYAELIKNRAFQGGKAYPSSLAPWTAVGGGTLALDTDTPVSTNLPTSVKVTGSGTIGLENPGWWGISVKGGDQYTGSFYARGAYSGNFTAKLQNSLSGKVLASVQVPSLAKAGVWAEHSFVLEPAADAPNINNSFVLEFEGESSSPVNFNLISLFPPTFNNRTNGLRPELVQALKDLNPSYFRIPGGNNLEGQDPASFWNWSATIGPLVDRPGRAGTWGYQNTDGLGLLEYLLWCQDIGAAPLLAVWGGFYLDGTAISEAALAPYVQDALNELEFCMGSNSTKYGSMRTSLGYPEPFNVPFVEIGNEDNLNNGSSSYSAYRFQAFYDAITAAYPSVTVVASTTDFSPKPAGAAQDYHEYTRPDLFVSQFGMFDHGFSAANPTFVGEYASIQNNTGGLDDVDWSAPRNPHPYWIGTVAEAVFLLGAERNAGALLGASYAPLLQNLNDYEWSPDLISFTADPAQTVLSTSYRLIKLFSSTRLATTLPATADAGPGPAYWVAGADAAGRHVLKAAVYNSSSAAVAFSVGFEGLADEALGSLTVLSGRGGAFATNVLGGPEAVEEQTTTIRATGGVFSFSLPDLSVAVLIANK